MTKIQKAIKELNKIADKAILKEQVAVYKTKAKKWLETEAYGYKRGTILVAVIVILGAIFSAA
jgi:hypothetical protein